jgi:hypothetical protein
MEAAQIPQAHKKTGDENLIFNATPASHFPGLFLSASRGRL